VTPRRRLRVAFVVPRYGLEVSGGAELHCRIVAERLAEEVDVEVFTSCALEYERWANHYPPGLDEVNGIVIHRFPVTLERDPEAFATFSRVAIEGHHPPLNELRWILLQGPSVPDLLTSVRDERGNFDLFVFWIYLYFPTYFGLPLMADKAVFVPLAHDEPPFHMDMYRPLFYLPRWIVFNSPEERDLIIKRYGQAVAPGEVVGAGAEPPAKGVGSRFRRKFGIADDFLLYVGRVNPSKGCHELVELFSTYKAIHPSRLKLVLIGNVEMELPIRSDVRVLGYLPEQDVADALAAATLSVTASRFESFSMTAMESWLASRPVLVNAAAAPVRAHVEASGGGLHFEDPATFCAALDRLLNNRELRERLATAGQRYAAERYTWDAVHAGWRRALASALARVGRPQDDGLRPTASTDRPNGRSSRSARLKSGNTLS
jgi:glycosyltransferase involved in cell wall biosynthesis